MACRVHKFKTAIISGVFFFLISLNVFAGNPDIISVTMNPSNPSFGDVFTVTVTYCGQGYQDHRIAIAVSTNPARVSADLSGAGQVFVVSRAGVDVLTSQPAPAAGGEIGYIAQLNPNSGAFNCNTCGAGSPDGIRFTKTYTVHVPPAASFPGCTNSNLYLHVGMKDNNIGAGEWAGLPACQTDSSLSWSIGTVPKNFEISKRVEGVLQVTNDLVLYSIDYKYWNGQLTITDAIPGSPNFTLVAWGPQSAPGGTFSGPAIGSTSGNFTWILPNKTGVPGVSEGSVWMLLRMNTNVAAGTRISNSATGTMSGVSNQTRSASIVVGQVAVSIIKDQSENNPPINTNITYYLTYQVNGSQLVAYQPFDDIPMNTYGQLSGLGGLTVPGWSFNPQAGTNGEWRVIDQCSTGDRVIRGDAGGADNYPSLLYDGLAANTMCKAIVMTDVFIEPGGYEGADAMVVIRSDGLPGGNAYGLVLSVDDFIGTNTSGNIGFQRCLGGTCIWPLSIDTLQVTSNKWWRVKIETAPPPGNNQYSFRAKVWAKGDPEPGWMINWTDPSPPAGFDCNVGTWKPGIAEQHGAAGDVSDIYDNFIIYKPRVAANTYIWDTVPPNVSYLGEQHPAGHSGPTATNPAVRWSLGSISDEGGTYTWWGRVTSCDPITNDSWITGDAPMVPNQSNRVIAVPYCQMHSSITKTASVAVASLGQVFTWSLAYCNVGPGVITNYVVMDTRPTVMSYGGCAPMPCGQLGGNITWAIGNLVNGAACPQGTVTWWGTVTGPFIMNPYLAPKLNYAGVEETEYYLSNYLTSGLLR